ncbi:MAG: hypothetical protein K8H87_04505, partial [Pseudorhodoplanes sp.]|nr:hypothetical protein [Pseudorhodoplanes sp.]
SNMAAIRQSTLTSIKRQVGHAARLTTSTLNRARCAELPLQMFERLQHKPPQLSERRALASSFARWIRRSAN